MTQTVAARLGDAAARPRPLAQPSTQPNGASQRHAGGAVLNPSVVSTVLETLACGVRACTEELSRLYARERTHLETIRVMREQLSLAASVQRDLLPVRLPVIRGLDVDVLYQPADVVSGDCYDVVRLDESRTGFMIADATGHGVPAALLAAFVKRAFRAAQSPDAYGAPPDPDAVLRRINSDLCEAELTDCQFVAALYAIYDERRRCVRWARGGIPYPFVRRGDGTLHAVDSEGPLIGIRSEPHFEVVELELSPGDTITFHTDGTEQLGDVRMLPTWDVASFEARISELVRSGLMADDVTLLSLRACA